MKPGSEESRRLRSVLVETLPTAPAYQPHTADVLFSAEIPDGIPHEDYVGAVLRQWMTPAQPREAGVVAVDRDPFTARLDGNRCQESIRHEVAPHAARAAEP